MVQSARSARPGGEFFARPTDPTQRRYEALRAYLHQGLPAAEVARRFGYATDTLHGMVREFRGGRRDFFVVAKPGPKIAPAKQAARSRIVELRQAGHSMDEIATALAREGTPLNRTGIAEVVAEEGFGRLWRRPEALRGAPRRETLPRAGRIDFQALPGRCQAKHAGLLLAVPDLVALDLPALVAAAGYPATSVIPATGSLLSLLALKLASIRRISHVEDLALDPGAALLAGLSSLPKTAAPASYSYRLSHQRQQRFLAALDQAMVGAGLADGADFDLDFHAIMHWGEDAALDKHYVPRRSQRTRPGPAGVRPAAHHPGRARRAGRPRGALHDPSHALSRPHPPHPGHRRRGVADRAAGPRRGLPQAAGHRRDRPPVPLPRPHPPAAGAGPGP